MNESYQDRKILEFPAGPSLGNQGDLMVSVKLTNEELDVLRDETLPHEARSLYLLYIRPHMDYLTGVVGVQRRVSYQMFQEHLEVVRPRGSTEADYKPSKQQVRTLIEHLVRVTLLVKLPTKKRNDAMLFKLPLACAGVIRPNEEQQRSNREGATNVKPQPVSVKEGMCNRGATEEEQHTSVISTSTSLNNSDHPIFKSDQRPDRYAPIDSDWQPSPAALQILGAQHSIKKDFIEQCIPEFVLYWTNRNESRPSWDNTFIQNVVRNWRTIQPSKSTNSPSKKPAFTKSSLDWEDTSWAENMSMEDF